MTPSELNLRALKAHDLIRRSVEASRSIWPQIEVRWEVQSNVGNINFQTTTSSDLATHPQAASWVSITENSFVLCSNLKLVRNVNNTEEFFRYTSQNGLFASIQVSSVEPARVFAIVEALKKHFDLLPVDALATQVTSPPEAVALQLREASVVDLHAHLTELGKLLSTIAERDTELRAKRMAELDAEHQARILTFERERAAALERDEQERQAKQGELAAREADLQKKMEAHNARESKIVRRDLLKELTTLLDALGTFTLSDETTKKRQPVTWGVGISAVSFLGLAVVSLYNYFTTLDLHYLPASTAGVLGFAGTMLFYVKWTDQWFREHADEEIQSKRYKADMFRASWIAELAAEWVKEGKDAPPELLAVFAKNLFASNADVPAVEHPADAILGLLKRAQKLDVGKDRVTLEAGASKSS